MGWFTDEENSENTAEFTNTNVVVSNDDPIDVKSIEIISLLAIITVIKVFEFALFCVKYKTKQIKKRYQNGQQL